METELKIPYVNIIAQHVTIKDELLSAIEKVLDHGKYILGDEVAEFEKRFAALCGTRYAVGLNSGTDALIIALKALGIGVGDEVITVPNSFVASTSCIVLTGANPVFVDVNDDYNINPALIEKAITSKTKAIIPVHLTGRPANMSYINEIAQKYGINIIEDCAQAVMAEYKGKMVGSFGQAGCFSLHPLKTLNACGDGGVLTTNDPSLYEKFKVMRNIGLLNRDNCVIWSGNSRLDTLQAAILLVKLKYLREWTEKRRSNAHFYQQNLANLNQIQLSLDEPFMKSVYHTFVIQADQRDELRMFLSNKGIGTNIHYPIPIHLQKAALSLGVQRGAFPQAEKQAQRILSLPIYPELLDTDLQYVVDQIHSFYGE